MTNQFCHFLNNGYTVNIVNNQLTWRPCCLYSKKTLLSDVNAMNTVLESNSAVTGWIPECNLCKHVEHSTITGYRSMRQLSFQHITGIHNTGDCISLEVNFDNKCNAACLSCSPQFSSTWEKYSRKYNLNQHITTNNKFDEFISRVPLNKLQTIHIQGGEPFYSDTGIKLLRHLESVHPALDQVTLMYQTNGSLLPDQETLDYWPKFKEVQLRYSIDDIHERFEYLRWPLTWNDIEKNIKTMIDTTTVKFHVNATINPLNAIYFNQLETWINQTIPKDRLIRIRAGHCLSDLDLNYSSVELKNYVQTQYDPEHQLSTLFNSLQLNSRYRVMFDYIEKHDQLRHLDWRKTFPETVKFYKQL